MGDFTTPARPEHTLDARAFDHLERIGLFWMVIRHLLSKAEGLLSAHSAAQPGQFNLKPDDIFPQLAGQPLAEEASSEIGILPKYVVSIIWLDIGGTNLAGSCTLCDQGARYFQIS
jgi:hypothetical protein